MPRYPRYPRGRQPVIFTLGSLLILLVLFTACGKRQEGGNHGEATAAETADSLAADSLSTGDSLAAAPAATDSSAKKSGGFLSRLFGGREEKPEEADEAVPVEMATVQRRDVPTYLSATASLEPEKRVEVQAKALGQIDQILVEEGDWVETGQLMARLDGDAQRVALEEATVRHDALQRNFERSRSLHEQQGLSDRELNDARHLFEQAEAQRKLAALNLEHTRIHAPFSGRVAERFVDLGQHVVLGAHLFTLVDPDPLLARIYLPEREAAHIAPKQRVLISMDTAPDLELTGEVLRIAPIVDRRTGTVKVTCQLPDQSRRLRPGSFVRVQVQTDLHPQVLVVPKRALVPEGGETYVFKVVADSVIKVGVETGFSDQRFVEILDGLDLDERVVTVGQGSLKTGSKVRGLRDAAPALADSASAEGGSS